MTIKRTVYIDINQTCVCRGSAYVINLVLDRRKQRFNVYWEQQTQDARRKPRGHMGEDWRGARNTGWSPGTQKPNKMFFARSFMNIQSEVVGRTITGVAFERYKLVSICSLSLSQPVHLCTCTIIKANGTQRYIFNNRRNTADRYDISICTFIRESTPTRE